MPNDGTLIFDACASHCSSCELETYFSHSAASRLDFSSFVFDWSDPPAHWSDDFTVFVHFFTICYATNDKPNVDYRFCVRCYRKVWPIDRAESREITGDLVHSSR